MRPEWTRGLLALTVVTPLIAASPCAFAQEQEAPVDALMREGLSLRRQGRDDEAFHAFDRAWSLSRSPRARAQMGLAAQALGRWPDADRFLREALAATSDAWVSQRRAVLEASLGEIGAHLGRLEVQCNVAGATVRVDGTERGTTPLREPLRLPTGTVTLQIGAAGYLEVTRQAVLTAGGTTREQIDLVAVPRTQSLTAEPPMRGEAIRPPSAPVPSSRGSVQRALAWTSGGVAVAGLALGAVALVLRNVEADTFNARNADADPRNDCPRGATSSACRDLESGVSTRETLSVVGFVVGGAAAIASAVLFVTLPTRAPLASAGLRACAVAPARDGLSLGCEVTF
jgi:hypothetical protein